MWLQVFCDSKKKNKVRSHVEHQRSSFDSFYYKFVKFPKFLSCLFQFSAFVSPPVLAAVMLIFFFPPCVELRLSGLFHKMFLNDSQLFLFSI